MKTHDEQMPPPQSHRLFIAISAPGEVRSEIEKIQNELRDSLPTGSIRWTRPEHFHLTLCFLGNVAVDRVNDLGESLRVACSQFTPLNVRAQRIGFFPARGFPRVIWIAVSDENHQLAHLQSAIQSETLQFTSEPVEKQFTGHITLGRVKRLKRQEADSLANFASKMHARLLGEWVVRAVELFRSELLPDGARHSVLATIPLAGPK